MRVVGDVCYTAMLWQSRLIHFPSLPTSEALCKARSFMPASPLGPERSAAPASQAALLRCCQFWLSSFLQCVLHPPREGM